jgi:myosin heavy subunit
LRQVFFKAGILAKMEEFREETLALMMLKLQNLFRWRLAVNDQKRRHDQLQYYVVLQRNIRCACVMCAHRAVFRSWCTVGTWPWFLLLGSVRPLIEASKKNSKSAAETEQMAALIKELESKLEIEQAQRHMLQKQAQQLREENDKVKQELQTETVARQAAEQKCTVRCAVLILCARIRIVSFRN